MIYLLRTVLGLGLIAAGCTLVAYAVGELIEVGSCATGSQPFAVVLDCPEGIGRSVYALFAAMPAIGFGAMLHAGRGSAPGSQRRPITSTLLLIWCGIFLGVSFASLWAVWGPDADSAGGTGVVDAARIAGISIGILFALMGVSGLILLAARILDMREEPATATATGPLRPQSYSVPPVMAGSAGEVSAPSDADHDSELERLQRKLVEDDR